MADPIVIVGAGVAGLCAARTLERAGRSVLLLDAAPEPGGRVRSTVVDGFTLDHGFQVLFTAYPTLGRFLDLPALAPRRFLPAARIARDGRVSFVGDIRRDPTLLPELLRAPAVGVVDALRLFALQRAAQRGTIDEVFASSVARRGARDFLAERGFSDDTIAGLFAPFYGGILLDRSLATSAAVLLFTFRMLAEGDTVVPSAGMGALSRQIASGLRPGTLRCGVRVASLVVQEGAVCGVRLDDGSVLDAAHVVLATDAPTAATLAATAGIDAGPVPDARGCTTVYFTARRTPVPGRALWLNAAADATISHAVTMTDVAPSYAPAGRALIAATAVGDAADLDDSTLETRARRELLQMGRLSDTEAGLERLAIWRIPFAQAAQPPGFAEHRPSVACGIPGLWRASEVLHSSSLEGAARGALAAAEALLTLPNQDPT
ncbi:MAG: FAD-dependent oxidoreductase [Gemmatimonadetes bacterium]|nr:FAD-dependent oxidoreductase [Gemmatimonadota bacterium]